MSLVIDDEIVACVSGKGSGDRFVRVKQYDGYENVHLSMSFHAEGKATIAGTLTPTQARDLAECLVFAADLAEA